MNKLFSVLRMLRPVHWSKNVFIFAALVFAQGDSSSPANLLFDPRKIAQGFYAFVCFCLLSSCVYVINDIHDVHQDRLHPRKRNRPLASGQISVGTAWTVALVLLIIGVGGSFAFSFPLGLVGTTYLLLNLAYSWYLKHKVIIDVMLIAIGFVLRAMAGVVAIDVPLSPWLLVCTFTLCLFVGFGKRRCELAIAGNDQQIASDRRPVLARYTLELLGHLLTISAAVAVITFLLYTMDPKTAAKFGTNYLIYTIPLVMYGIFRFAVLIQTGRFDGPIELLISDRPFQATIAAWLAMAIVIVHWGPEIRSLLKNLAQLY